MANENKQPQTLAGALATLGGIAGFLWGGTIGHETEDNFLLGALIGAFVGAIAGRILGIAVSVAIRLAILAGSALVTVLWFYTRAGGTFDNW